MTESALGTKHFAERLLSWRPGVMGELISRLHDAAERLGASGKDGTRVAVARMQGLERSFIRSVEEAGYLYEDGEIEGIRDEEEEEKEGEGIDKRDSRKYNGTRHYDYTKEQYEAYGWVRANDVLNYNQYRDFTSKFADVVSRGYFADKSSNGEYMIPVGGLTEERFAIDNTIVFAKGTINNPVITRVIKIELETETEIEIVRGYLLEYEKQDVEQIDAFESYDGQKVVSEIRKDDVADYWEYSREKRRRSSRGSGSDSQALDGEDRERGGDTSEVGSTVTRKSKKVTAEQDAAYMEAVEAGDMETAQRMVEEAEKVLNRFAARSAYGLDESTEAVRGAMDVAVGLLYEEPTDVSFGMEPVFKRYMDKKAADRLFMRFNSIDNESQARAVCDEIADMILANTSVRQTYASGTVQEAAEYVDVLKGYRHKADLHGKNKTPLQQQRGLCSRGTKSLGSVHADALLVLGLMLKLDGTVDQSKEGIIAADADVVAGTDSGASLTDDDHAGSHSLTVSSLHAKALGLAVTAVLGGTDTLLMSKELQTEL